MSKKIDNYRELPGFEVKELPTFVKSFDEAQGVVEHFVAVFGNVDEGGDRIVPGAFRKSILERGRRVKVLDMHSTDSVTRIVGKPLALREVERSELTPEVLEYAPDATGALLATTQYAIDTSRGADVFKLVRGGYAPESSIGYDTIVADYVKETGPDGKERTVRLLKECRLWEYSNVIFGMNSATAVRSAKAGEPSEAKPVETTENYVRVRVHDPGDFDPNAFGEGEKFRTIDISKPKGIRAVIGKLKGEDDTTVQSYLFDKEKWNESDAQSWVDEHEKADKAGEGPDAFKFTGSPRNPYGTHASRGYPGGRSAWKRAWRIHLSGIRDQGPVQGTVRRVSMIAAGMKPACKLPEMSADSVGARSGACGKLSGDYKETPGDYGLSQWKDPSDDNLTREDIQLTCQDLEDLKRICLQEIAKRQACSEEGKNREGNWDEEETPPGEGKGLFTKPELRQAAVEYLQEIGALGEDFTEEELHRAAVASLEAEEGKAGRVLAARNAQRILDAVRLLSEALKDAGLLEEEEQDKASVYGMKPPIPLVYDEKKGHVIFPTGKSVYANNGFGGTPSDTLIPYGSDGAVSVKDLDAEECIQLADYVIYQWLKFREKYAPGESRAAGDSEQDGPPSPTSDREAGPQGEKGLAPDDLLTLIEIEQEQLSWMEVNDNGMAREESPG